MTTTCPTDPTDPTDPAAPRPARRSARVRRFVLGTVVATAAGGLAATAAVAATSAPSTPDGAASSPSASAPAAPGDGTAPAPGCGPGGGPGAGPAGPGRGDRVGPPAGGTVTALDGDTLTLTAPRGETSTVTLTDDTVVVLDQGPGQGGQTADRSAITVGQRVHVELTSSSTSDDRTAARVVVEPLRADGDVTAVDGGSLTIAGPDGTTTVVDVAGAEVLRDGETVDASSITVGEHVHAEAAAGTAVADDGSFTAARVEVGHPAPPTPPAGAPTPPEGAPAPGDGNAPTPGQDAPVPPTASPTTGS
ncbi:hypothetical protein AB2L27_16885 [Kineococcus sp. LSe6-4]|uniref:DUF5666 domain-containing protein n=1 Tax=Kineococcus halophytocola TaxID=3234027 RepID=A0ABV4H4E4_9ACTN